MAINCPQCSTPIELVQSTPAVILLCKGCGQFYNAQLEPIGDLKSGLELDKIPTKPMRIQAHPMQVAQPNPDSQAAQAAQPDATVQAQEPLPEKPKTTTIFGALKRQPTGLVCPNCRFDGMKQMVSGITGNTLYTCPQCGYTGTKTA